MRIDPIEDPDILTMLGKGGAGDRTLDVVHLSDIYKILMKRLQPKRFDKRDKQGKPLPMDFQRVEIGLLFETTLERALAEKFATVRPGELVSDEGVFMTPDGVNPEKIAGEEYKCTYMSSRHGIAEMVRDPETGDMYWIPLDKFIHWFIQMKGYAKWLEIRKFILTVLFLCGDYTYPITPQFRQYEIEFTDEEVEENWTMLMNIAREERLIV